MARRNLIEAVAGQTIGRIVEIPHNGYTLLEFHSEQTGRVLFTTKPDLIYDVDGNMFDTDSVPQGRPRV